MVKVIEYIKSDLFRYTKNSSIECIIRYYFKNATFRFLVALRLCSDHCDLFVLKCLGKIMWLCNFSKKNIQISPKTSIGYGLYIGHCGPVVVNKDTIIGNNVNLSPFVTIGSSENKNAVIGNNTFIGSNVNIVEDVRIGNNVTIGAGAVVTRDIPDNATAVGNYAKVINYNNPGRFIINRWKNNL